MSYEFAPTCEASNAIKIIEEPGKNIMLLEPSEQRIVEQSLHIFESSQGLLL